MCIRLWMFLSLSVLLSACSIDFGDQPKELKANIVSGTCIADLDVLFAKYLEGQTTEEELQDASDCVTYSLQEFNKIIKDHGFHPQELTYFLNNKVIGKEFFTKHLTEELMKLKVLFIGGKDNYVRKEDFDQLIKLVEFIAHEAVVNLDFIQIYRGTLPESKRDNLTISQIQMAKERIKATAIGVAGWLERSGASYDFKSLEVLIREISKLLNFEEKLVATYDGTSNWLRFMQAYKKIHVSGSREQIESEAWEPLLKSATEYFGVYLDYKYLINQNSINKGDSFEALNNSYQEIVGILSELIRLQESNVLKFDDLEELLISMQILGLLPPDSRLTDEDQWTINIKDHLMPLLRHLNKTLLKEEPASEGFTQRGVHRLASEFRVWSKVQKNALELKAFAQRNDQPEDFKKLVENAEKNKTPITTSLNYIVKVLPLKYLGYFADLKNMMLSPFRSARLSFEDVSFTNNLKALGRLIVLSTAKTDEDYVKVKAADLENAQALYEKVYPILHGFKILGDKDPRFISNLFQEASVFTPSGSGFSADGKLPLKNIVEEVSILWTSINISRKISALKLRSNNEIRAYIEYNAMDLFLHLPELRLTYRNDRIAMARFFDEVWSVVLSAKCDPEITQSDVLKFTTIIHYIESLLIRYDINYDGQLVARDVLRAFPRFQYILEQEIQRRENTRYEIGMQKSIFFFLAIEGRVPGKLDYPRLKKWDWWYFDEDPEQYIKSPKADAPSRNDLWGNESPYLVGREEIAKVFGFFTQDRKPVCE